MVGHAGSTTAIAHADMTLTQSQVKATGLFELPTTIARNCTFLGLSPPTLSRGVQN